MTEHSFNKNFTLSDKQNIKISDMLGLSYIDTVEYEIIYSYTKGEPMAWDYPGCAAEVEIHDVTPISITLENGIKVTHWEAKFDKELQTILPKKDEIELACFEDVDR